MDGLMDGWMDAALEGSPSWLRFLCKNKAERGKPVHSWAIALITESPRPTRSDSRQVQTDIGV